jgi:hypothetical protein
MREIKSNKAVSRRYTLVNKPPGGFSLTTTKLSVSLFAIVA